MNEIEEVNEDEHPVEIKRSARNSRHHATMNLDVVKKKNEKEVDPKFREYIRKLQQEQKKDRLASFGDKVQDHLKRSVKEHLERVREKLENLNKSKALYELVVEDPEEHAEEDHPSQRKQRSLASSVAGGFNYHEDEMSKGTQTVTVESREQGSQSARVRVSLNSGTMDQLIVTERISNNPPKERYIHTARTQLYDKRAEMETNKENSQHDSNKMVVPARKLHMKNYETTDRENFMEELSLSDLMTHRTQSHLGFTTERTLNQTESLDLSRFRRPVSTPLSKYEEFRDTETHKSSQFPEIDDDSDRVSTI